jgi:hypothetical protein
MLLMGGLWMLLGPWPLPYLSGLGAGTGGPTEGRKGAAAQPGPAANAASAKEAAQAVATFLQAADLPEGVRTAMITVLRHNPQQDRWAGRQGTSLFAMASRPLPQGDIRPKATPPLLSAVHMLAVQEVLTAKSLLDSYTADGLTDVTTLKRALLRSADGLKVTGRATGLVHEAKAAGDFAVAYVVGDTTQLVTFLHQPAELAAVRDAYRDIMHEQARDLMKRKLWSDAVVLWRHLHSRKLVSQTLYLDAATCLSELDQPKDALTLLDEAYRVFAPTATAEWLEQCGDRALHLGPVGERLAQKAYEEASRRLLNTTTGQPTEP